MESLKLLITNSSIDQLSIATNDPSSKVKHLKAVNSVELELSTKMPLIAQATPKDVKDQVPNFYFAFSQALFVVLAIAYVAAIPVDESVFGDSVDSFHPQEDQEILKKLLLKKLFLKKKLLLG